MDWRGALTLVPGLVMLVLGLMQSEQWGWRSNATVCLILAGLALLIAFVRIEMRSRCPLVDMGLFASRNFAVENAVLALVQFALTGMTVFGAIYVQEQLGFTPIAAGLSLLPVMVPLMLLAPRVGALYDRIGPRALVAIGAALVGASLAWTATVLGKLEYAWLVPAYVVGGAGLALVMTPASTDAMNVAPAGLRAEASGVIQTLRQLGGTVGLAIMGTVVAGVRADGGSSVAGISAAYYIGAGVVLVGALLAGTLLRHVRAADAKPVDQRLASVRAAITDVR
jgi:MFS family permease